jgi:hypothetical protein
MATAPFVGKRGQRKYFQGEDSEQTGTGPKNCFDESGKVYPKLINTCKRKEPRELSHTCQESLANLKVEYFLKWGKRNL